MFAFFLNQIDKDIDQKYNLSSDMKMNTLRSLTLGKVTGTSAGHAGLDEEVLRAGSKGFIGCLSSVQFNHLTPLKTAILNHGSSLVHVLGNLVESNCGALADSTTSQSASGEFNSIDVNHAWLHNMDFIYVSISTQCIRKLLSFPTFCYITALL